MTRGRSVSQSLNTNLPIKVHILGNSFCCTTLRIGGGSPGIHVKTKEERKARGGEGKETKDKREEKKMDVVAYTFNPSTGVVYGGEETIPGALWEQVWPTWHVPGQ